VFSPWAPGATKRAIVPALSLDFDFDDLVRKAVIKERELDDDDAEGAALNAATEFLPPLDAVNVLISQPRSVPIPPTSMYAIPPPTAPSAPLASHHTPLNTQPLPPQHGAPKYRHGSTEDILRKKRGKAKRAMQRLEAKKSAPHGFYAVKPAVLNRHIRPATAITTKLDAQRLKCTKNGWTGARDKGGHGRIFALDEMVGEGSRFKFRLERWDGR
jgi:hypothetical protein